MPVPFIHFVFVDFENVPKIDLAPIAGKAAHVTLLIGKKQTWLDLELVKQLLRLHEQVALVEVGATGRNALDMVLAGCLGRAVERHPGAQLYIISKDRDYVPLIEHLKMEGVKVSRHESIAALPFLTPARKAATTPPLPKAPPSPKTQATPKPKTDKIEKLIAHLRQGPPGNRTKLEHAITAFFKPSLPAGGMKGVIAELEKRKVLAIDTAGKVAFP